MKDLVKSLIDSEVSQAEIVNMIEAMEQPEVRQVEYIDRMHDAVLVAEFQPIRSLDDIQVGDFFICPKSERYGGLLDSKTHYPILYTVARKVEPFHIRTSEGGRPGGSIAYELCLKMSNPG